MSFFPFQAASDPDQNRPLTNRWRPEEETQGTEQPQHRLSQATWPQSYKTF